MSITRRSRRTNTKSNIHSSEVVSWMWKTCCLSSSLLLLSLLLSISTSTAYTVEPGFAFPKNITLTAGVLHALPFASVNHIEGTFTGFQPDLLERLQVFAKDDGVDLNFVIKESPSPQYGPAFDYVANDCNTTENPHLLEDCLEFDLIVGNYYSTPSRALRVDLSPAWLRSTISTIKSLTGKVIEGSAGSATQTTGIDITTLSQADQAEATICIKDGTYYMSLVMNAYPNAKYLKCPNQDACIDLLKGGNCMLYPDDELQLIYRELLDPTGIQMTREQFNTQYIAWPISFRVDQRIRLLMRKWIYNAVSNATLDELYGKYFEAQLCPFGTAGPNCEDYCHPEHGLADVTGNCVCDSNKWTGDDCATEVLEDKNLIPPTLKILGYSMFGVNLLLVCICGVWLYVKRETTQVKVMQPFFLAMVLLGCTISSSTIVAMADESSDPDDPVKGCMAIPWLYSVGFSITFGTLFAKIRRVFLIFQSAVDMKRATVSIYETLAIIGVALLVDVIILTTWTIVSPLKWNREILLSDTFGEPLESVGYCTSDQWQIFASLLALFHFTMLAVACYLCYQTRNISTEFSEAKYLAIAMVSNMQIFLVGLPVLVIVGGDPETSFFVRSVIIWMNDLVVVTLIFGNLMYSVYSKPKLSVRQTVERAQRRYSQASSRDVVGSNRLGSSSRRTGTMGKHGSFSRGPFSEDENSSYFSASFNQNNGNDDGNNIYSTSNTDSSGKDGSGKGYSSDGAVATGTSNSERSKEGPPVTNIHNSWLDMSAGGVLPAWSTKLESEVLSAVSEEDEDYEDDTTTAGTPNSNAPAKPRSSKRKLMTMKDVMTEDSKKSEDTDISELSNPGIVTTNTSTESGSRGLAAKTTAGNAVSAAAPSSAPQPPSPPVEESPISPPKKRESVGTASLTTSSPSPTNSDNGEDEVHGPTEASSSTNNGTLIDNTNSNEGNTAAADEDGKGSIKLTALAIASLHEEESLENLESNGMDNLSSGSGRTTRVSMDGSIHET